jgi:hypothetical protein
MKRAEFLVAAQVGERDKKPRRGGGAREAKAESGGTNPAHLLISLLPTTNRGTSTMPAEPTDLEPGRGAVAASPVRSPAALEDALNCASAFGRAEKAANTRKDLKSNCHTLGCDKIRKAIGPTQAQDQQISGDYHCSNKLENISARCVTTFVRYKYWLNRTTTGRFMNPKLIVAAIVIVSLPVCAQAQKPRAVKVTNGDAQKVVKIIAGDKAKIQIYCDVTKLSDQIDETDPKDKKKIDELNQQMDDLAAKLGPEYVALVGGLEEMDPDSKDSKDINSTLDGLDKLCPK